MPGLHRLSTGVQAIDIIETGAACTFMLEMA